MDSRFASLVQSPLRASLVRFLHASPHETFGKLVDFYLKGQLDIESLITRTYPLEEINEGFDALARGEDGRGIIVF